MKHPHANLVARLNNGGQLVRRDFGPIAPNMAPCDRALATASVRDAL